MNHLLKMNDLTREELYHILDVAVELKAAQKAGGTPPLLAGKSVALMFSKASTRTRTSFEVGVFQLGGLGSYMNAATELQASRGEPLRDTARVLGRYYDCIVWRTYRQRDLEELAEYAGVPVINGLTDYAHPCQVLADLMTIRERRGALEGQKLCFVGDGNNMANSLIVGGLLAGMQVTCVCPPAYRPAADVLMFAHRYGQAFNSRQLRCQPFGQRYAPGMNADENRIVQPFVPFDDFVGNAANRPAHGFLIHEQIFFFPHRTHLAYLCCSARCRHAAKSSGIGASKCMASPVTGWTRSRQWE